jgi:hypothetical protein
MRRRFGIEMLQIWGLGKKELDPWKEKGKCIFAGYARASALADAGF